MRFLFVFAILAAIAATSLAESATNAWMGRVLVVQNPAATAAFEPQPAAIERMVGQGIAAFTGAPNEKSAWLSLVSTNDRVGVKVHSLPGASGTRKPVVEAIVRGLLAAGLPPKQIIVWDRRLSDLRQAGFFELAERHGIRIAGAVEAGFDETKFYETALLGKIVYGDLEFGKSGEEIGRRSYVSKLVVSEMTKIISVVPLLNHNVAGVIGNLHSLAMGSIDNTLRFEGDSDRLASAVPEIYALEPILDKVVLSVVDALICQYQGEERSLLHYSAALNELWISKDPVALDVLSIQELIKQRADSGAPKLRANLDVFRNAAILDLGASEPSQFRIERLRIEAAP